MKVLRLVGHAAALALLGSSALATDPVVTPVGAVLADPVAFHRRPVVLQGVVRELTVYERRRHLGREQCAQGFKLEDETGAIDVVWTAWCQIGEEKAVYVGPGDLVTVHATIDAPPDVLKDTRGAALGYRAVASKIAR